MADIKLFKINGNVEEIQSSHALLEKHLQTVIENNMQDFFGVTFLASEFTTNNSGRMDSLGIDENNCPVIFEYKRSQNENVINQGLFYLDWLLTHKDSFKVLVIEKLGLDKANEVDWTMPRVICIAGDFNKYDESAINQMNRNISLIRYKKFGEDLLMFEQLNQNVAKPIVESATVRNTSKNKSTLDNTPLDQKMEMLNIETQELYIAMRDYFMSLGDDISEVHLKNYIAFKKIFNIASVGVDKSRLRLYLKLDEKTVDFEEGFTKNTSYNENVLIELQTIKDLEKAKPLIERAYKEN